MGMKNRFQEAIQNVQRQRHLARRSVAMVLVLAMLTAMSVSWRLHQDGIALAADDTRYYCGKEEHKHTDDCYIEGTEPICGYEEGEIVEETMDSADDAGDGDASAADWDEAGSEPESEPATQEEPEPEVVLHHHTADCYEEEEVLTCGIESDHVHQDYCYDQETGELLCTEHEHTDDCYTLEKVLVCGQEEGEPEKTDDGAALYDTDENSAEESDSAEEPETVADPEPEKEATKPETDDEIDTGYTVHHHTAECYGKVLICGKEEHEHTAACLVNPNAETTRSTTPRPQTAPAWIGPRTWCSWPGASSAIPRARPTWTRTATATPCMPTSIIRTSPWCMPTGTAPLWPTACTTRACRRISSPSTPASAPCVASLPA